MENNKIEIFLDRLYSTSDLALAALLNLNYPLKKINNKDPKRVYFIFEKDKNFDLLTERYWRGELNVNPQEYYNSLKFLKSRIYNQ